MITKVIPIAITPVYDMLRPIEARLDAVRKLLGLSIVSATHIKINTIKIPKISFFRILFIREGLSILFSTLSILL